MCKSLCTNPERLNLLQQVQMRKFNCYNYEGCFRAMGHQSAPKGNLRLSRSCLFSLMRRETSTHRHVGHFPGCFWVMTAKGLGSMDQNSQSILGGPSVYTGLRTPMEVNCCHFCNSSGQGEERLPTAALLAWIIAQKEDICYHKKYKSVDGSCVSRAKAPGLW